MRHPRCWNGIGLAAGLALLPGLIDPSPATAQQPAQPVATVQSIAGEETVLMQAKLSSSKKLLEALLRRDFDSISRAARELKRISKATEWPRQRDEVYEHFAEEFQRQCNQLENQANQLNHDGIQFTYLSLTSTCIRCHDYIRDARRVAELPHPRNVRPIPSQWPAHSPGPNP